MHKPIESHALSAPFACHRSADASGFALLDLRFGR